MLPLLRLVRLFTLIALFPGPIGTADADESHNIHSTGVGGLRIGQVLPRLPQELIAFDKTILDDQGAKARLLGVLINNQVVQVELEGERIFRIRILEPGIRTLDGVEVGAPISIVARRVPASLIVGTGADLILLPTEYCGVAYWTNYELDSVALLSELSRDDILRLPERYVVKAIVVTGKC